MQKADCAADGLMSLPVVLPVFGNAQWQASQHHQTKLPDDLQGNVLEDLPDFDLPLPLEGFGSEREPAGKGGTVLPIIFQSLAQKEQGLGHALVFFAGLLDLARSHEVLELLVSAQPQHFFAAAGGIPSPESRMNDAKKSFELVGFRARKGRHQLLSDIVRDATVEGAEI